MKTFCLVMGTLMMAFAISPVHTGAQSPVRVTVSAIAAPIFVKPDATMAPVRLAKEGSLLTVVASEGEWYRIDFDDPQLGRRIGYVEKRHVSVIFAPAQQAVDLTVPESTASSVVQPPTPACPPVFRARGSMSAIVDGVPWSTHCVDVSFAEGAAYFISGTDDPNGSAATFRRIAMTFPAKGGTGTFPYGWNYSKGRFYGIVSVNQSAFSGLNGRGTLTITTFTSTNIVGTFSFTTGEKSLTGEKIRSLTVADGHFDITFTR